MLPGHPGQEGRHHGRQRDHLRRRPRAPEERHRTAGRGQVSPHRRRAPVALSLPGRRWGTAAPRRGRGEPLNELLPHYGFAQKRNEGVLSAGTAAPRWFTDLYRGRALEAPGAVLRLRETPIPCSKRELEGLGGAPGNQPPSCWVFSFWGSLAEGRARGGGQGAIEAAPARAASRRSSASAFPFPPSPPASASSPFFFFLPSRKANVVLETRQLAMKIFEDYTVSWYWIIM